jgi:hypothetical protein
MSKLIHKLFSWLGLASSHCPKPLAFRMYTRKGCHLCEEAWKLLQDRQDLYHFTLDAVDVDADPDLAARYGEWVPVVTVNGQVRFRGGINPVLLDRLLWAEAHGPEPRR